MSDDSSRGKMYFFKFYFVNVKGNWTHLAQKNLRPGARIIQYLGYHENILIVLVLP